MKFLTPQSVEGIRNIRLANAIDKQLAREKPLKGFGDLMKENGLEVHDLKPVQPEPTPAKKTPSNKYDNMPEYDSKGRKVYPFWKIPEWSMA